MVEPPVEISVEYSTGPGTSDVSSEPVVSPDRRRGESTAALPVSELSRGLSGRFPLEVDISDAILGRSAYRVPGQICRLLLIIETALPHVGTALTLFVLGFSQEAEAGGPAICRLGLHHVKQGFSGQSLRWMTLFHCRTTTCRHYGSG